MKTTSMKIKANYVLVAVTILIGFSVSCQDPLKYAGKIGPYSIEVDITANNWEEASFEGKYRYAGKKAYLTLKGEINDDCYYIEESYNGKQTGEFYLMQEEGKLTGYWVSGTKSHPVELDYVKGDTRLLIAKSLIEYSSTVSDDITGSYGNELYFINDMWYEEGKPDVEIGFNGGHAVFEQLSDDSLRFSFELICGPTYHFAFGDGVAVKQDSIYVWENEDGCHIEFTPGEKSVYVEANNSMECGFGARAYVSHKFFKISDSHSFEETSLKELKAAKNE